MQFIDLSIVGVFHREIILSAFAKCPSQFELLTIGLADFSVFGPFSITRSNSLAI